MRLEISQPDGKPTVRAARERGTTGLRHFFHSGGESAMQMLNLMVVTIVWVPIALVLLKAAANIVISGRRRQRAS